MWLINSIINRLAGYDVQGRITELSSQLSDARGKEQKAKKEKLAADEKNKALTKQIKEDQESNSKLESQIKKFKQQEIAFKGVQEENAALRKDIDENKAIIDRLVREKKALQTLCDNLNGLLQSKKKQKEGEGGKNVTQSQEEKEQQIDNNTEKDSQQNDCGVPDYHEQQKDSDNIDSAVNDKTPATEDNGNDGTKTSLSTLDAIAEEAICLSKGDIEDFPDIVNDTRQNSNRTIRYVFDNNYQTIFAKQFFENSKPEDIAKASRDLSIAYKEHRLLWYCPKCHQAVKIAHWKNSLFFIHAEKNGLCEWRNPSQKYQDLVQHEVMPLVDNEESGSNDPTTIKYQELKNRLYAALITTKSQQYISDVRIDCPVHDTTDNKKWTRADISFLYKGRLWVIELQHKGQGTSYITEKDKFYCSNNIQTLWVFGSDSDTSYEYLNTFNYKATLFDSHRNAFVFDRQAQQETSALGELRLKCNWLDSNDEWHFKIGRDGINGETIGLDELTIDDEHCKPYFTEANDTHKEVKTEVEKSETSKFENIEKDIAIEETKSRVSIENIDNSKDINVDFEIEHIHDNLTQSVKKEEVHQKKEVKPFSKNGFWGFKTGNDILIEPTFTEKPKVTSNGYFQVCNNGNIGLIDKYGKVVVGWNGFIQCDGMDYDSIYGRILFYHNGKWGVADKKGNILIEANYTEIKSWSYNIYKVSQQTLSGLCNIHNELVLDCKYSYIGELNDGKASVQMAHPYDNLRNVMGSVRDDGKPVASLKQVQKDGNVAVMQIGLWGVMSPEGKMLIPCQYDSLEYLSDDFYAVKFGKKLGIVRISDGSLFFKNDKGYPILLKDGKETILRNYGTDNSNFNEHKIDQKPTNKAYNGKKTHDTTQIQLTGVVRRRIKNHGKVTGLVVALLKDGKHIVISENAFTSPMPKIFSFHVGDKIHLIKKYNKKGNQTLWQVR